ncbi:MAG: hypothetical protein IKT25_05605, partial [Firmicutes bacterium]|nr:hypothetical protein [Bacillota bacterium]
MTSVPASVADTYRVYAKWEADSLKFDPSIGNLENGDGIPDVYQCVVQFHIVGGTWGDQGGSAPIGYIYSLKEKNSEGKWVDANPTLGSRIPTNMKCVDENTTQGSWNVDIDANTPVNGPATYTYTYTHSVTVTVENGSVTTRDNQTYVNTTFTLPVNHNSTPMDQCEFTFKPQSGYALKSVVVDGEVTTGGFNTSGVGIIHVDHERSHKIHVIYDVDINGDNVADSFQKKILFQVVNGTWNVDNHPTLITRYVTLTTAGGIAAEDGTANIQDLVPNNATPAVGYKGGSWDVNPADNGYMVSGPDDVTYTFIYQQIQYYDYHYSIHHILQQTNGTYAEDMGAVVEKTVQIELNLAGNGFESGKVPTLTVAPSDY